MRSGFFIVGLLFVAACSSNEAAIDATVVVDPAVSASCLKVVARAAGSGQQKESAPILRGSRNQFEVAIYQAPVLGSAVYLTAQAYSGSGCTDPLRLVAQATQGPISFVSSRVISVTLRIGVGGTDGGQDGGQDGGSDGGICAQSCNVPPGECFGSNGTCVNGQCAYPLVATGSNCSLGTCLVDGGCGFGYPPSNFDPAAVGAIAGTLDWNCTVSLNSTPGATTPVSGSCVSGTLALASVDQNGGPQAAVLAASGLHLGNAGVINISGTRPVIFAVYGDSLVEGQILAGATGPAHGGGGSWSGCGASTGGVGAASSSPAAGAGGGGGGLGTPGAPGGAACTTQGTPCTPDIPGADAGAAGGNAQLTPLRGGCSGGAGGDPANSAGTPSGGGGGAFQISAARQLQVGGTAVLDARGGGGLGGLWPGKGGGGGGSGGGILLESQTLQVLGAALTANGGGGGGAGGAGVGHDGGPGTDGWIASVAQAAGGDAGSLNSGAGGDGGTILSQPTSGQDALSINAHGGGGGGGGAVGRIRFNVNGGACVLDAGIWSPIPTGNAPACP